MLGKLKRPIRTLSELTGIPESTLYAWRHDPASPHHREPSPDQIEQIVKRLEGEQKREKAVLTELRAFGRQLKRQRRASKPKPTPPLTPEKGLLDQVEQQEKREAGGGRVKGRKRRQNKEEG